MFSILQRNCFRYIRPIKSFMNKPTIKNCSSKSNVEKVIKQKSESVDNILGSIANKYQVFRDEDSSVILDINEQKLQQQNVDIFEEERNEYEGLNLERGETGVYEIEDLVEVLKRENALNIFVAAVPTELKYVDYICVITGKSYRHMVAIAQFVRKLFKIKRNSQDILPKIEGKDSKEWIAMDLGNIALHIFSTEARIKYDLDSLWSLGEEYDDECNKPDDPIVQLLQQHTLYLKDLVPADEKT